MKPSLRNRNYIRDLSIRIFPTPEICVIEDCVGVGERHHLTYDDPYNFVWYCKLHHRYEHSGCFYPVAIVEMNDMKSINDINKYCVPHLVFNPGLFERVEERLGFKIRWTHLDMIQAMLVFLAIEHYRGSALAGVALDQMTACMNDDHSPT